MVNDRYGTAQETALDILQRDHLQSDKLGAVCQSLAYSPGPKNENFLREVMAKNPHREVQGLACMSLGLLLKSQAPVDAGVKYFNLVIEKYGDLKHYRGTLADAARSELFELHNLAIGKTAPEIQGEDVNGNKFKLSDYRGKVVVLDFWGDW
jgi:hypothetical protein